MASNNILGSIYWPIIGDVAILRRETIPLPPTDLFSSSTELFCPHITADQKCLLQSDECDKCAKSCYYDTYQTLFLLLNKDFLNRKSLPIKCLFKKKFDEKETMSYILNVFPQPKNNKDSTLKGWPIIDAGIDDNRYFDTPHPTLYINAKWIQDLENLEYYDKAYAYSEITAFETIEKNDANNAFIELIKKNKIKDVLFLGDSTDPEKQPIYLPVLLSFFADKKIDALFSLGIKHNSDENIRLVRQALGSMREVIYSQRQNFLEKWCMRLGERVDDIIQTGNSQNQDETAEKAMVFAFRAILYMTHILSAAESKNVINQKQFAEHVENYSDSLKKNKGLKIFDHLKNNLKIFESFELSNEREIYVQDFCKKAEMYAEEYVASEGKLKGRLSAPTVRDLKKIARTSDPVNARILIKGEPGGGKGVTADDFHFYCMKKIASQIKQVFSPDADGAPTKVTDIIKVVNSISFIKKVKENIGNIFLLPANYSESCPGLGVRFFLSQISNTGWWLWYRDPILEEDIPEKFKSSLKKAIEEFLILQEKIISSIKDITDVTTNYITRASSEAFLKAETTSSDLKDNYIMLLVNKILFENSSKKPDWSFNMLQMNCGILGGENSELADAIERLFGKSGNYRTAMPGLFQTCSYMGGTLFLDEIADTPVRVQDNLLRPLEEGLVSRPGWETFDEDVSNIRIIGATFKDLFNLSKQYYTTLDSGHPKGFRPDLLTRLTRNTPVSVAPVWHYFGTTKNNIDDDFPSQFAFVLNNSCKGTPEFWKKVYFKVLKQINEHCDKAKFHIPDEQECRRKFASKITMRLFKEVGKIAQLNNKDPNNTVSENNALDYLGRMLDYLLVETN